MAEVALLEGVAEIAQDEWDALVADDSPFLEWGFLASLEQSGAVSGETGWGARPLVVREEGRLVAACPVYVKGHSEGEFVFDWGWADAAHRAGIDYYPKLLVGVPFTPVTGGRLLTAPGAPRPALLRTLAGALREICRANGLSGVHVNFCREDERDALEAEGFHPRLGLQYHWHNHGFDDFEGYLGSLRSKRRNQVRRERRELEAQDVEIEVLTGDAISTELAGPMFEIYRVTVDHHPYGRRYLNRPFFDLLHERFRDRLCHVVARQRGEIVAGAVNVQKGDALYGRYWGCFKELRHLHFNVCYYAGIEHSIRSGFTRFEPGAGGSYKQMRGFDAHPTWSAHYLADPRLDGAVARFLEEERREASETIDWYRENTSRRRGA